MNAKMMKIPVLLLVAFFTLSVSAGVQVKDNGKKTTKTDKQKKDEKKEEKKAPDDPVIVKKLESVVVPSVDFQKISLVEAVKNLNTLAKLNDPEKVGVLFTIDANDQISGGNETVTFTKDNVTIETILKVICKKTGYAYVISPYGVKLSKTDNRKRKDKQEKF
jgi:hypothetical protein